jgi:hypothetical protein
VSPAIRRTPPDRQAVSDDDLDGPSSEVRPVVPLLAVPQPTITLNALRSLPLDAASAYLFSLVDGQSTVQTMLDICEPGLTRDEALTVLAHLLELGAIHLRDP